MARQTGIITGSGGLVKNGAGTLTLTAANTFTGATAINLGAVNVRNGAAFGAAGVGAVSLASGATIQLNNAGTLDVLGKIQNSAITVQLRGTLAGTGTTGSATVQSGGTIAPGSGGAGLLNTGALNLNAGAQLALEIGGTAPGTQYDQATVTGGVTLAGDLQGSFLNGFTPAHGDRFFIIINDGVDAVSGTFAGFAQGSTLSFAGRDFMVGYTGDSVGGTFTGGNDVVLQSVPEPNTGTILAASLGLALGLQRIRRRRQHTHLP